ncbi:MAG: hypothetical protein ACI4SG_01890 [Oligosphaeraceae bacterium]
MPKTPLEKFVFALMMSVIMVVGMETYNQIPIWKGLLPFLKALSWELPMMTALVMVTQQVAGTPLATALAKGLGTLRHAPNPPGKVFMSCCMVVAMCPLMSAWATLIFKLSLGFFPRLWLFTFLRNLPMAVFWQLLVAGPLVRWLFSLLFPPKEA